MENIILAGIILLIVIAAGIYVFKARKNGEQCIGCPHSKNCKGTSCSYGCSHDK